MLPRHEAHAARQGIHRAGRPRDVCVRPLEPLWQEGQRAGSRRGRDRIRWRRGERGAGQARSEADRRRRQRLRRRLSRGGRQRRRDAGPALEVEFKLIRGSKERLQAFDDGEVDVMLLTLDYFANLVPVYKDKGIDVKAFMMADWSRGNLGIVAKPSIKSIEGLKDAKIATTRNTPTHYFLLNLLKRSNLSAADIEKVKSNLVFATKTPQAGEMFQRGEVDAVAIWEPHLSQSAAAGKGRVLVSTATASNLIADVLFARKDYIQGHEGDIAKLVEE